MKFRTLLTALALAVFAGPLAADETELGAKMEKMGGAFRALRRQISDASKNADSLAKLAVIRQNAEAATKLDPAMTKDIPAAKQKEFVARYQAEMKKFLDLVGKVEAALKANNNAEAAKLVSQLADAQKAGHKEFKKEDKKK
ncbi:MAG: cytochrome b562 [Opitutaceae bacterium]